jgi:acyl transferase domain-containing protein
LVSSSTEALAAQLKDPTISRGEAKTDAPVIFAFPGQGSQRAAMGYKLYQEDEIYREEVDKCAALLTPRLGFDIRDLLCDDDEEATAKIMQTAYSQPGLFVVDYALAKRLMASGIEPVAMIGHSLGELVAACLAGVFSLADALALVALRGKLMQACEPGSMVAIFETASEIEPRLKGGLEVAAYNAPDSTVISGSDEAIKVLCETLDAYEVGSRVLQTSHAFHSASVVRHK